MSSQPLAQDEFTLLLKAFNSIVNNLPPFEKVKKELLKIKEQANRSSELNYRQKDAIVIRCDNYVNGNYGNTKRPEHLEQSKTNK